MWWSTKAPKKIPEIKTTNKYNHHINEVTIIDFVSRYAQKTRANQIKLFATEHKSVFPSKWKKSLFLISDILLFL